MTINDMVCGKGCQFLVWDSKSKEPSLAINKDGIPEYNKLKGLPNGALVPCGKPGIRKSVKLSSRWKTRTVELELCPEHSSQYEDNIGKNK
jgi:hypothetical protein